ncbi:MULTISPECIES: aldo/keto reductase [Phenylobacterium]|uniref:2,5-diketo-D-gluconate reductase A n=1 Tax=Phenylobacterium koreense TaxID=266125 RepID=A0ABV2EKY9_9CAUL
MDQPLITFNDGASLPQLGLGVWQVPDDEAAVIVKAAVEAGYRHVDTAAVYQNETGVGAGLAAAGVGEVAVTTKLWNESQGYDRALRAFDKSLQRLGRESVELYLIHWPCPTQNLYVESWKALVRLKEEGRVRSIGVSNFNPDHLRRIVDETGVVPAVNQIELHPRFQQADLRAAHAELGIVTECWSPLGQGTLLQDPVIAAIAAKHGKTPAQAVIRWHLDSGFMVIPKSANPDRVRQNFAVFDFALDAEDMAAIAALDDAGGRIGPNPATLG